MTATADIQPPVRPLYVGATVTRARDDKLLRGTEMFVSDVRLHDAAEMAIVRSPFAHAEIVSIDVTEARALPGVIGVWTAEDLHGISAFPDFAAMAEPVTMLPLATTKVRYVGMPVAVVVAEDRYIAEDAAELVAVDYSPLPAVTSIEQSLDPNAPRLFEGWASNRLLDLAVSDPAVDEAIEAAASTLKRRYRIGRHTAMPIETRRHRRRLRRQPAPCLVLLPNTPHVAHGAVLCAADRGGRHQGDHTGHRRRIRAEAAQLPVGRAGVLGVDAAPPAGPLRRGPQRAHARVHPRP